MRYTEEKETKNKPKSQAVTVSMRWDKSAYSSFLAICKTAVLSSGRSLWTGATGPGLRFSRLWPFFFFQRQHTKRRRLILQKVQVCVIEIPSSLAFSVIARISTFCCGLNHVPFISPTNPHSFFFSGSPIQQPVQREPVLSPPTLASGSRNPPEEQSYSLLQAYQPGAQGHLLSLFGGCGLNQWSKSLREVGFLLLGFCRLGILKISGISSQVIIGVVSFYLQMIFHYWPMVYSFHCGR